MSRRDSGRWVPIETFLAERNFDDGPHAMRNGFNHMATGQDFSIFDDLFSNPYIGVSESSGSKAKQKLTREISLTTSVSLAPGLNWYQ
jgi:hypothetical protein